VINLLVTCAEGWGSNPRLAIQIQCCKWFATALTSMSVFQSYLCAISWGWSH